MCVTAAFLSVRKNFLLRHLSKNLLPARLCDARLCDAKGSHEELKRFPPVLVDHTHSPIVSHQTADEGGVECTERTNRHWSH